MPGNASVTEANAQPQVNTLADFSCALVGYSSASAVGTGAVSPAYTKPGAAAADMGAGDMVDACTQMLVTTNGNPTPPPVICVSTPATNPATYGTIDITGVAGTSRPTNDDSVSPLGTYQPWLKIVQGGTVGAAGMTALASLGANYGPTRLVQLGSSGAYDFPASDGWGVSGRAGFVFAPPNATETAAHSKLNALKAAAVLHFVAITGSPAIHLASDTGDSTALNAIPNATDDATSVTLFQQIKSYLGFHGADTTVHTSADTALATALAAIPQCQNIADVDLHLPALVAAYSAHIALVGSVHGSADGTHTVAAYTAGPGTLVAGDLMQTTTQPPQWDVADLFTAANGSTDATGALAVLARSTQLVGRVVITEPVAQGDVSTLKAALDYALGKGRRWRLICRFRDPNANETDAQYITAFQTFVNASLDNRITYLAGSLLVSDAFSGRVYLRTFMAPYLARLQGMIARPGLKGERLAQNAGWVDAGPLEGASLRGPDGNPVVGAHDEAERGGIVVAPGAARGGGMACYYLDNPQRAGVYIDNRSTVAYDVDSEILTPQDRDVANALETAALGVMLGYIGGADIIGDGTPRTMDPDIASALEGKIMKAIGDAYPKEFANPNDPSIAAVDDTVVVSGANVSITGELSVKFFAYTDNLTLTVVATR